MDELVGPLQEVFKDLRQKWKEMQEEPPFMDIVMGFVNAVDWKETWIQALVAFHVALTLTALLTRKQTTLQGCIFALAAGIVFMAERLNTLGAKHWPSFSKQDYFDTRGVFFCTLISGPLVLNMFIVLINYLISCSSLLIQAKRQELRYKAKARQNAAAAESDASAREKKKEK